ncbi:MAG: carboxylating nicotinate-nucleotide diphosphorylase [Armatimonadota bacterium]
MNLNYLEVEDIVRRALLEDIGTGDITTVLTIPEESTSHALIVAKEDGVIAGVDVASLVFGLAANSYYNLQEELMFTPAVLDGTVVKSGATLAVIEGPTRVILTGERTALNLMQRMSGIATKTARLVELVAHTNAKIIDTRKTTPGLRILEKYSVRMGGGQNHRFGLYDAVLIKDNHIQACGGIVEAVQSAKAGAPHTIKIEVEADTVEQVEQALKAGADMILLDNMDPATLKQAVDLCKGRATTEASGGITEETIVKVAEAGVDLISVGALTHSVKALDISLDIVG